MNAKIRRRIARAKQKIESQLAAAVVINDGGPVTRGRPRYEFADKARANPWGGIGLFHRLALKLKLPECINEALHLLKLHVPYNESDHVLNIAYNLLCGGRTLDDIEHRPNVRPTIRSAPRASPTRPRPATSVAASTRTRSGR